MKTSKLTTWCGVVIAVSTVVAGFNFSPLVTKMALCISGCANAAGLVLARDNNVSDEKAGAK